MGLLPVTANVVLRSPILVNLMMEAIRFSEMWVLTTATRRNISEDGILQFPFSCRVPETLFSSDERLADKPGHCKQTIQCLSHPKSTVTQYVFNPFFSTSCKQKYHMQMTTLQYKTSW
jgi:hypothetical protein